jgi:hypothetical protein
MYRPPLGCVITAAYPALNNAGLALPWPAAPDGALSRSMTFYLWHDPEMADAHCGTSRQYIGSDSFHVTERAPLERRRARVGVECDFHDQHLNPVTVLVRPLEPSPRYVGKV